MHQRRLRAIVATIILVGHFLVFAFGLFLGIFGPLTGADAIQTLLMASPVLGVVAGSVLTFSLRTGTRRARGPKMNGLFSFVAIFFPSMLIGCIFIVFMAVYKQLDGFGPDEMRIALGGIELFFGIYLGAISEALFPRETS
jgi:hypothetical protein